MRSFALTIALLLPCAAVAQNAPVKKSGKASVPRPKATGKSGTQTALPAAKAAPSQTPKAAKTEPAAPAVTLTVRAITEVPGAHFTLGEIADLQGKDSELIAQLAKVEIGTSPIPGQSRNVTPGDITVKLRAAKLESARVSVNAPPVIRVTRARNDVPPAEITQAAMPIAQGAVKDLADATLEPQPLAQGVTLPTGRVVLIAGAYRGEPEMGTIYVPVSMNVDGKPAQTVEVAFKVRRRMSVVAASRTIEVNDIIAAEDVSVVRMELPSGFTRPLKELQEVVGKRAKRQLRANLPISAMHLDTPPDLTANARVTIEFIIGPVRISAPGIAREAGAVGDTIRVYAPDTKKEVEAVIVDGRTVRVPDESNDPVSGQERNE